MKPFFHLAVLLSCAVANVARAVSPPIISGVPNAVIARNTNTGALYFEIGDAASATLTASTTFNLTVTAPNTPPTIAGLPPCQIVCPAQTPAALNFTVGDAETAAASWKVAATFSNTNPAPVANIARGGSGANRTVQITPVAGRMSAAMNRLNATDGTGASAQGEFTFSGFQPASANNALKNGRTAGAIHRPSRRRWKGSSNRSWKRTRSSRQRRCWIVCSNSSRRTRRTRSESVPREMIG